MGLAAVPHDHPRFLGMTGMHGKYAASQILAESDLLIAIGTRFSDRATGNKTEFTKGKKVIHIDIDPSEIGKNIPAYVALLGDVKTVLQQLLAGVKQRNRPSWRQAVQAIKDSSDNRLEMPPDQLNPETVIKAVRRHASDDTVVCTDVVAPDVDRPVYDFSRPRTFITSGGFRRMGFGMGAAIGACFGTGGRRPSCSPATAVST